MSFRDATKPQDVGPDRLKPVQGTPILDASGEASGRAVDLCAMPPDGSRARILVWLAEGARAVTWALCSLPRERWAEVPPTVLSERSALAHVCHLAVHEAQVTLPAVYEALGLEVASGPVPTDNTPEASVERLGETRFELLQRLETAPEDAWERLERPLLHAHQHELEHLAVIWRIGLNWDRASRTPIPGVPLHPADRLEESH
jgi:hypothetical protein